MVDAKSLSTRSSACVLPELQGRDVLIEVSFFSVAVSLIKEVTVSVGVESGAIPVVNSSVISDVVVFVVADAEVGLVVAVAVV